MRRAIVAAAAGLMLAGLAAGQDSRPAGPPPERERVVGEDETRSAIQRAIAFLVKDQNPEGSWGGPRGAVYTFTGSVWSNPETHRSWKVATTGLAVLALLESGPAEEAKAACDRGIDYLIDHAVVKQPSEWDTMNSWAYIYGLQALVAAYQHERYAESPRRERMRPVAEALIGKLLQHQTLSGGWGYLEFDEPRTVRPQWATSFTTAAGLVALLEAKAAGFSVDEGLIGRATRAVQRCRLPTGAYTYSVNAIADPRGLEWIDQIKGSLGRIQVCNESLRMAGDAWVTAERMRDGLEQFFRHHRFLEAALNRPIPHEAYYYNSGYFYLFGHYYAARVIRQLPEAERARLWPRLRYEVIRTQAADGSMWDYDMHAYHKPYGASFGLLALIESLES